MQNMPQDAPRMQRRMGPGMPPPPPLPPRPAAAPAHPTVPAMAGAVPPQRIVSPVRPGGPSGTESTQGTAGITPAAGTAPATAGPTARQTETLSALTPADRAEIERAVVDVTLARFAANGKDPAISTIKGVLHGGPEEKTLIKFGMDRMPQFGMFHDRFDKFTIGAVIAGMVAQGKATQEGTHLHLTGPEAQAAYAAGKTAPKVRPASKKAPAKHEKPQSNPKPRRASEKKTTAKAEADQRREALAARAASLSGNDRAAAEHAILTMVADLRAAKGEAPAMSSVTYTLAGEAADFIAAAGLTANPRFGELKGRFDKDLLRAIATDMVAQGKLDMEKRRLSIPATGTKA